MKTLITTKKDDLEISGKLRGKNYTIIHHKAKLSLTHTHICIHTHTFPSIVTHFTFSSHLCPFGLLCAATTGGHEGCALCKSSKLPFSLPIMRLGSTLSLIPESSSNSRPRKLKDVCKWVVKASMKVVGSIREAPLMGGNKKCEIVQRKLGELKYF